HDLSGQIAFSFEWALPQPLTITDPVTERDFGGSHLAFSAKLGVPEGATSGSNNGAQLAVTEMQYVLGDPTQSGLIAGMKRGAGQAAGYTISAAPYELVRQQG